ncbi:hypothetical protein O181_067477 [Austropuccinia psidii MF-1]|uniref:Uncharacterized protein n=1 Tax=Austropuccinia psidii MF-1 TaxID=1389203 RepID=A0A9Q3F0T2_9BASI|nr:hypothetical protein [Austropuccinia psidii MF-1]
MENTNSSVKLGQGKGFTPDGFDPEALRAVIRGTCHLCQQPGHFARTFLNVKKNRTYSNNSQKFQDYHPILEPMAAKLTIINTAPPAQKSKLYCP